MPVKKSQTAAAARNAAPRRTRRAAPVEPPRAYTSREAAEVSGVPFFTIDYWGRTKFLEPSVARGAGRGKGRQRMYSYGDLIRIRIARELRLQKVSLETLRAVIQKLRPLAPALSGAHFVLVGKNVELVKDLGDLNAILRRPGRETFGMLLDLRELVQTVRERAHALD